MLFFPLLPPVLANVRVCASQRCGGNEANCKALPFWCFGWTEFIRFQFPRREKVKLLLDSVAKLSTVIDLLPPLPVRSQSPGCWSLATGTSIQISIALMPRWVLVSNPYWREKMDAVGDSLLEGPEWFQLPNIFHSLTYLNFSQISTCNTR